MLTDANLRSQVDVLWDKLWSGGLSNPLDAIEQLSFLLFLKRLDEREQDNERAAKRRGKKFEPLFPDEALRWSHWMQLPAEKALKHVREKVFPFGSPSNAGSRAVAVSVSGSGKLRREEQMPPHVVSHYLARPRRNTAPDARGIPSISVARPGWGVI